MNKKRKPAGYNAVTVFDVVLSIAMILFMATIILPFVHIIAVSLSDSAYVIAGKVGLWPKGFTLTTYIEILNDGDFFRAYGNTVFYTVGGTMLSVCLTALGGYVLSRKRVAGHKLYSVMITITMFFGGGLVPTYLAVSSYGLVNTPWAMILPGAISTWNLIVMRSFFVAYPTEIIESGMIDGLQDFGVFTRLVLPTSKAALATIGLYYAVGYWNAYIPARLYIRNEELYPVQHLLRKMLTASLSEIEGAQESQLVVASVRNASIMITVIPIMCVYPFLQKYFVKGVMVGSIKG